MENIIGGQNAQQQIKVNVDSLPTVVCRKCGSEIWQQAFIVKKVSALQSPTGKDEIANIPILLCTICKLPLVTMDDINSSLKEPAKVIPPQVTQKPKLHVLTEKEEPKKPEVNEKNDKGTPDEIPDIGE